MTQNDLISRSLTDDKSTVIFIFVLFYIIPFSSLAALKIFLFIMCFQKFGYDLPHCVLLFV